MKIKEIKVHPDASIFPMLPPDELQDLAADIKQNGQQKPIVLTEYEGEPAIIDGRNRRAACEIAGVDPKTTTLNGVDPKAYIVSANINRRHMSKGQRAMAVAMIYPQPEKGGRGKKSLFSKEFSEAYLSKARTVLRVLPELAQTVISGATSLSEAYTAAAALAAASDSAEAQFAGLRTQAPDLADLVTEEKISLSDALAALRDRQAAEHERRLKFESDLRAIVKYTSAFARRTSINEEWVGDIDLSDAADEVGDFEAGIKTVRKLLKGQNGQH